MKKTTLFLGLIVILILCGAGISSYGTNWAIDGVGLTLIAIGAVLGTFLTLKKYRTSTEKANKKHKVLFIILLGLLWVSTALFSFAGVFYCTWNLVLAILGFTSILSYAGLMIFKKF